MQKRNRGFSLIEVMIVVVIIAILATIAYPSYARYVFRAHRADAQNILTHIATAQERHYATYNKYTNDLTKFGYTAPVKSEHQYYEVAATTSSGDQKFMLTAKPVGSQAADDCKNLTVDNVGTKGFSGAETNGKCW